MNKDPKSPKTPASSRRTGIDRRWVRTPEFFPERRKGGDRRAKQRQREFLPPLSQLPPEPNVERVVDDGIEEAAASESLPETETTASVPAVASDPQQSELFYLLFSHMRL